ncbi:hypothetical protein CRENPOLYSF1_50095 [Crenothrix polyspora]|uniref:Uncharacterized protein n=1 Tax=Crenothrix polyspora TaxID=360316 RepID=A0A1R4HCU5_9GAMM|nr:hypothetical protein CRENPOLYSF1_50095 [Crenothrix polyspora]
MDRGLSLSNVTVKSVKINWHLVNLDMSGIFLTGVRPTRF